MHATLSSFMLPPSSLLVRKTFKGLLKEFANEKKKYQETFPARESVVCMQDWVKESPMGPVQIRHSSHDFATQSSHFVDREGGGEKKKIAPTATKKEFFFCGCWFNFFITAPW